MSGDLKKYGTRIMIAAIQEIKLRGNDVFDSEDYTVCYSGSSGARNVFGTRFFVHKKLKQYVMKFEPVDESLCHLRIKRKFFNISVICAHGGESKLGPLGTSAIYWPIVPAPGDCEDGEFGGETEVLGENLPQQHFVHHKFHLTKPGLEPGPPRWEASD
jgi:hypothetical protein